MFDLMSLLDIKKRTVPTIPSSDLVGDLEEEKRPSNRDGVVDSETATAPSTSQILNDDQQNKPFDLFFGFFDGWTMLEKYFFFILLMILFYQLHIFSFFHIDTRTLHAFDLMSADHGFAPGIDFESVDTQGQNWVPVYDRETQVCMNLDSLIKIKGDVTTEERKQWKEFQCPDRLKGLYSQW